jgi:2-polyprenyl-3-methyl-5-hydroxy-6-metoxy-1,4-benzoquinol methylase
MELNPKIRNRYIRAFELIPQKTCRLLDFGCSTGGFLGYLHKKACCKELYGCDVSSEAIAKAQYSYPEVKFAHISSKIPFPNSYFDVVTMLDVLEHVPNEHDVLNEIARVLAAC